MKDILAEALDEAARQNIHILLVEVCAILQRPSADVLKILERSPWSLTDLRDACAMGWTPEHGWPARSPNLRALSKLV